MQLWACFLETDLQNPKKAQHLGWFIPLVSVECGRSQSRNPQGQIERAFPFHLARRCGQGQGPALRPLLSRGKRTCSPTKAVRAQGMPSWGGQWDHPPFFWLQPPQLALPSSSGHTKSQNCGVCVEGFRKEEGGRRDTRVGKEHSSVLVNLPPDFGETAPRCRWFARPSRWRLPNRKYP